MSFQKCPLCNGSGIGSEYGISSQIPICSVCKGTKIINEQTGLPPKKVEQHQIDLGAIGGQIDYISNVKNRDD